MRPGARPVDLRQPGRATVLAWAIPHLLAHLAASGADGSPIRGLPGVRGKNLGDPDLRLPDAVAREAWRVASEIAGDDALGLHMARALPRGALDLLEYAFRASPTLEAGLRELERYGRLLSDRAAAHLAREGDSLVVTLGREGAEPMLRQRAEFALAIALRLAREATATSIVPVEVHFAHRAPESLFEHRQFFRAPLRFEQAANRLLIAQADASRPLEGADAALVGVVRRRLDRLLAERPAEGDSTSAAVRRVLMETLELGQASAAAVARDLGMSARTLNRRLRTEGTWFRGILDAVRGERATALLRDPAVGIGEIAFVLGYSEPTAFHRSFKRWTGQTPARVSAGRPRRLTARAGTRLGRPSDRPVGTPRGVRDGLAARLGGDLLPGGPEALEEGNGHPRVRANRDARLQGARRPPSPSRSPGPRRRRTGSPGRTCVRAPGSRPRSRPWTPRP